MKQQPEINPSTIHNKRLPGLPLCKCLILGVSMLSAMLISACSSTHSHWGYRGVESPEHWAELSSDYSPCHSGHYQSPIDLHSAESEPLQQKLVIAYLPTHTHIVNNGHTIEFDMDEPDFIAVNDKRYQLKQLHFHADSKHTVNGVQFPAEMHLVHQAKDGELAVIALLIEVGHSTAYDHIFDVIPHQGEAIKTDLHLEQFIPVNRKRFTYYVLRIADNATVFRKRIMAGF